MTFKKLALATAFSAFSAFSYAQDVTQGVVIEGESIPIGISIGDRVRQVEAAIGNFSEFDLQDPNRSFCSNPDSDGDISCTYIANDDTGSELGEVIVDFRRGRKVDNLRWSFENWTTTTGLSLAGLKTVSDPSELEALYPNARVTVFNSSVRNIAIVDDTESGLLMVNNSTAEPSPFNGAYGEIFKPF
ncbi:hypothetical protein [Agarilytica rhodophyticola]|uniref:hypothetical protein n=1 Tax=Agarilytica rhodophyticola TaxID=1737490 RepID=UPI000B34639B|nr:hypothetical protein [Agarilytica rhodophyticola]